MKIFNPPLEKWELRLFAREDREFFNGTLKTFGLRAALTMISPLLNTILNFKYRNKSLAFIDHDTGEELHPLVSNAMVCELARPNKAGAADRASSQAQES